MSWGCYVVYSGHGGSKVPQLHHVWSSSDKLQEVELQVVLTGLVVYHYWSTQGILFWIKQREQEIKYLTSSKWYLAYQRVDIIDDFYI